MFEISWGLCIKELATMPCVVSYHFMLFLLVLVRNEKLNFTSGAHSETW